MFQDYPKYCEFENDEFLKGDKVKIEEILNKEVLITGIKKEPSKVKKGETYNKIQVITEYIDDVPQYKIFFTTSQVLERQIMKYKSKLPFCAVIIKQNNYYTLT